MTEPCENCRDWGRTIDPVELDPPVGAGFLVQCGACKRLTWPNLGVNLSEGCASAFAATRVVEIAGERYLYDPKTVKFDLKKFDEAAATTRSWVKREAAAPLGVLSSASPKSDKGRKQDHRAFLKRVAKRRARKKK